MPGFLLGEELAAAYASSDILVMPSRTETLGLVVLEAMSSGLPVVAARAGGIPELIDHGVSGFLYDDQSQALAAIQELLRSPREHGSHREGRPGVRIRIQLEKRHRSARPTLQNRLPRAVHLIQSGSCSRPSRFALSRKKAGQGRGSSLTIRKLLHSSYRPDPKVATFAAVCGTVS